MNPEVFGDRAFENDPQRRAAAAISRRFRTTFPALVALCCGCSAIGQRSLSSAGASMAQGGAAAGHAAMSNGQVISYTSWRDPKEGAFTVDVPRGWKVTGGLYRFAPIDVRPQVAAGPMDGSMLVQMGDARLATFAEPGPSSQVRGLHNGQSYTVNGVPYVVMPYLSGAQFSKQYVQSSLGRLHPDLQVTSTRSVPELARQVDRRIQGGAQTQSSMGETDFTYTEGGVTVHGACIARTQLNGQGLGAVWTAFPCSAMTKRTGIEVAKGVAEHMLLHTEDDPEWSARAQQTAREFSEMVLANHERALAEMNRIYTHFTHQLAEDGRVWSNILTNQVDVRNPTTGQTYKAEAGHNSYSLHVDTAVGADQPVPGWIPLEKF